MLNIFNNKTPLIIAMASVLTAACSGSSDTPLSTTSVSGVVADGYLENANVCLDINLNKICDVGEPSAISDANGAYSFEVQSSAIANSAPVLVEVIANVTVDSDTGTTVPKKYVMSAPAGKPEFISPLTTMVQAQIEANPGLSVEQAESEILISMGQDTTRVSLFTDYIEASQSTQATAADYQTIHHVAQVAAVSFGDTIEAIETDVNSGTVTVNLTDDYSSVISVVVNNFSSQMNRITAEVANHEAALEVALQSDVNATFDVSGAVAASAVTYNASDFAAKIALQEVVNTTQQTTMEALLTAGLFLFEGNANEVSLTSIAATSGAITKAEFVQDATSNSFAAAAVDTSDYVLTTNGWETEASVEANTSVTFNADGSATINNAGESFTLQSNVISITGSSLSTFNNVGVAASALTVFSAGAEAYRLSMTPLVDVYKVESNAVDVSPYSVTTSTAVNALTLADMMTAAGSEYEIAVNSDGVASTDSSPVAPFVAYDRNNKVSYVAEMIGSLASDVSGAVNFYQYDYVNTTATGYHTITMVTTGIWTLQTVKGVQVLTVDLPNVIRANQDADAATVVLFAELNGQVSKGEVQRAGITQHETEWAFNEIAITDIITSVQPQ